MASPWHVRTGVRAGVAAGVLLLLAVAFPAPKAWGQGANMILQACRRIEVRQIVAGSQVYYTQCTVVGQFGSKATISPTDQA